MANKNLQSIVAIFGLNNLPDSERAVLLEKMVNIVGQRFILRALDNLAEDKREEFKKLIDAGGDDSIQNFLLVNVPRFSDWLSEEIAKLKEEMQKAIK